MQAGRCPDLAGLIASLDAHHIGMILFELQSVWKAIA